MNYPKKTRVCAYARVSTKDKEQLNSFENQISYFKREFGTDKYELVRVYADCGKSGTSLRRPAFDQMILDAGVDHSRLDGDLFRIVGEPLFSRILVKNTSRFARNVSCDLLLKTLAKNGVYVDFIDTNLSTERAPDILTLQVLQVLDEHESRDKSRKVLFGLDEGIRRGNIQSHNGIYGYSYLPKPDNRLVAIPEEASVVRKIFQLYTEENFGAYRIAGWLTNQGILTRKGNPWNMNTILGMLKNEAYTGKAVRRKYTCGLVFDKHTERRNEAPIVFSTDRIDPIVNPETFDKAQVLLREHAEKVRSSYKKTPRDFSRCANTDKTAGSQE